LPLLPHKVQLLMPPLSYVSYICVHIIL